MAGARRRGIDDLPPNTDSLVRGDFNFNNDRNEVQQNAQSGRKYSPGAQFATKNHRKGKIMPKEKTFWVYRDESRCWFGLKKEQAKNVYFETMTVTSKSMSELIKIGELKQFKIIEVKRGTKK